MVYLSSLSFFFSFFFFFLTLYYSHFWNMGVDYLLSRVWVGSFECGFLSSRIVENYFSGSYINLLVLFVVFDIEVSLLLNMPLQGVMYSNFVYYVFFLFVLLIGFFVEIFSGYVNWGF